MNFMFKKAKDYFVEKSEERKGTFDNLNPQRYAPYFSQKGWKLHF